MKSYKVIAISSITSLIVALVVVTIFLYAFLFPFFAVRGKLPDLRRMELEKATRVADSLGFNIVVAGKIPSDIKPGLIAEQIPEPGEKYRKNQRVKVYLSKEYPSAIIPPVRGLDISEAKSLLHDSGFFVKEILVVYDTLPSEVCVKTEPEAGEKLQKGEGIKLFVSIGPEIIEVPNVVGKKISLAKDIIESAGLEVGTIKKRISTEHYQGVVIAQSPKPKENVPKGTKVDLVVASVLK